jgi:hypothetical protein
MSPQRIGGGCFCGAVRYSIALPPRWVAHCHCTMCRRAHGAAFVTWVGNLRGNFTLERGEDVLTAFKSSGSLDDAAGLEPGANVYWSHRVAWGDASRPDLRSIDLPDHSGDP